MVAKFVALYPYEELAVIQNSKNDGISRRQQLNNRVKYAEACLQDSKWLLRDDFLRLAFLDYLVTEPPENSDKEKKTLWKSFGILPTERVLSWSAAA